MFNKKNKEKKEEVLKHWDKEEYIFSKINSRTLGFYVVNYRKNLNKSILLVILSLILSLSSFFVIVEKNKSDLFFLNTISGRIIQYELDETKINQLKEAFKKINEQNNR